MPAPTHNPPSRSASKNDAASNSSVPQSPASADSMTIVASGYSSPSPSATAITIPSSAYRPPSRSNPTTTTRMTPAPMSPDSNHIKFKSQEQIYELFARPTLGATRQKRQRTPSTADISRWRDDVEEARARALVNQGSDNGDQSSTDVDVLSTSSGRALSNYSGSMVVGSLSPPGLGRAGSSIGGVATVTLNVAFNTIRSGNPQYIPHEAQYEGFAPTDAFPSNPRVNNPQDGSAMERYLDSQREQPGRITVPRTVQGGGNISSHAGGSGGSSGVEGRLELETEKDVLLQRLRSLDERLKQVQEGKSHKRSSLSYVDTNEEQ
ncbi:hypothetical protein BGZ95_000475 [Linnemannia exigua]|uniref:Uncharacterized protein n=1 Tax=Linnemannia exigua TaxID=604196 RepID=A0AAD4D8I1_9FUNG|nr:hypothetical protein BGZ95_000475 [Linnemannia exigua]